MNEPYHLTELNFTPAPGWEHRIMATPEIALGHARQIYDLTTEEYELAIRSRHPLRTHRETMESNALITEILQLQSHLSTFINSGRWKPDWAPLHRKHLPEHVRDQIRIPLDIIHTVHQPWPFSMCVSAWVDHAIRPAGLQSVSYLTAFSDWNDLTEQFVHEPEYPRDFQGGVYLGFPSPTKKFDHVWHDVAYDPNLGYRAARHILRINHAGREFNRAQHAAA